MRYLGIALVYAWRYSFGLLTPPGTCKYHPSCSQYALDALRTHGLLRGSVLTGWRLLRCNPLSDGGLDPLDERRLFPTPAAEGEGSEARRSHGHGVAT